MLSEVTSVPDTALPLEAFKAHLRLGTGFGVEDLQDSLLIGFLRAALAAVEKRTGKVLIARDFLWQITRLEQGKPIPLPRAPVLAVTALTQVDAVGDRLTVAQSDYELLPDVLAPRLCAPCGCWPSLQGGGYLELAFQAGFGTSWDSVPADLAQAVLMLAAHFYEYRNDTGLHGGCMPFGVASLIERYRPLRLSARALS